ncbi:uncharacterized protein (TIGR03089 family) [Streptomyces sp. TLI_235]|nr:uncharacterized protein (TIGR03089 family) [Streptomyces sp. TLI_235]
MTAPFAADARIPAELLHAYLRPGAPDADPSRPLITFYDDSTGERVELSAKTFDNWVAKTANLLQDELNAGPRTAPRCCCRRTGRPRCGCWPAGPSG